MTLLEWCIEHNKQKLLNEWHYERNLPLRPEDVSYGSNRIVWWKCSNHLCNHEWQTHINSRSIRGDGCPVCAGKKVKVGFNDLATLRPDLAAEWHPTKNGELTPYKVTLQSNKKVWWIDKLGHEWPAVISHMTGRNDRCPFCINKKVSQGFNDLLTLRPDIAKEWNYEKNGDLRPENVMPGSNKKVWWKCSNPDCGDEWEAQISRRCSRGSGCPVCDGKKVKVGFNDFATAFPLIADEWHSTKNGGLTPSDVTKSSNKRVWWKCGNPLCGHEWKTTVYHRSKGQGCPKCNKRTSFPEQAIYYYLQQVPNVTVKNREKVYGYEIDVYIEDWGIGIEYDGIFTHSSPESKIRDGKKDLCLKENGITLIRIKESDKSFTLNNDEQKIIYCIIDPMHKYIEDVLERLFDLLSSLVHVDIRLDISVDRDRQVITALCNRPRIEKSLAYLYPELAKAFHPLRNGNLKPTDISYGSGREIWWLCPNCGHEWLASPHGIKSKHCPKCNKTKEKVPIAKRND